jgi:two-component system alkaline phosphatase synthesis response regulator PhoP
MYTMNKLIYVVEDEQSIVELYQYALTNAGFSAQCFESGEAFFPALKNGTPDLILLDIMLEGMDGYEILRRLKCDPKTAAIPVIMVSAKGDELSKVKGLDLGADGYLGKPFGVLELVSRIKANLRKTAKPKTVSHGDITVDDSKHEITVGGQKVEATKKLYDLLRLFVSRAGSVIERDELLDLVWGTDYFGETRTLDIHITELRKKLSECNSVCEIATIRGVGYLLR